MLQYSLEWWISKCLKCKLLGPTQDLLNSGHSTQQQSLLVILTRRKIGETLLLNSKVKLNWFVLFVCLFTLGSDAPFLQDISSILFFFNQSLKVIVFTCVNTGPEMPNVVVPVSILTDGQRGGKADSKSVLCGRMLVLKLSPYAGTGGTFLPSVKF